MLLLTKVAGMFGKDDRLTVRERSHAKADDLQRQMLNLRMVRDTFVT